MADLSQEGSATLRDYVRIVWLRKWFVLGIVVVFTLLALAYSFTRPKVYEASAQMMYSPPTSVDDPGSASSIDVNSLTIQLQSVGNIINTARVRAQAKTFGAPTDQSYSVTATVVIPPGTNSSALPDSVNVTARASSPGVAADVANAYAKAVIEVRKEDEQQSLRAAQEVIRKQLDVFRSPQSKLSPDYASLSLQLRNLQLAEATANGDFVVFAPATAPKSPVTPKPVRMAAMGLIAGLFVGIVAAFVLAQFDVRIRSYRDLSSLLGLNLLGRIPRLSHVSSRDSELIALSDPGGTFSEAMRIMRSNLEWSSIDEQARVLMISSCLKGEGKTLALCNLAITLARTGKRVIVVDADLRNPRVHRVFDMANSVGLSSVALGVTGLSEALRTFEEVDGVHVRTAGNGANRGNGIARWDGSLRVLTSGPIPPNPGEVVASRRVQELLHAISELGADYVLVDTPPILAFGDVAALAQGVDGLILVVNIRQARRPVLEEGREILDALPCRKVGLVVTGERIEDSRYSNYSTR